MAFDKRTSFTQQEQDLAAFARSIGHPARIAILRLLAERDACICGDIVEELPLAQSTVSQHLKELKAAGLIQGTIDGPRTCYCINWQTITQFQESLGWLFNKLTPVSNKSCC